MTEGVPEIVRFSAGLDDLDPDLESKPRRRIAAENYNDYLHATRTFSGNETPDTLTEVRRERFRILQVQMMMMMILMMMMMILQVPKKCTIKQFVLSNNLEFKVIKHVYMCTVVQYRTGFNITVVKVGRGFYEFTKPEIISHRKEVVLMERAGGAVFTGQEACRMVGAGTGIRIPPTFFNKWRVFVQSTSYGRILLPNTSFLYEV